MTQFSAISAPVQNATFRVLSLGAGVQSTVMALLAARGEIGPMPDLAIFADTQWEPKSVYKVLDWLRLEVPFPIEIVTAGNIREDVLAQRTVRAPTGKRFSSMPFFTEGGGIGRRQCTSNYKIEPIQKEVRRQLGVKPRCRVPKGTVVEQWIGISTDELQRVKDAHPKWLKNRWPLIERDMSRHDCLRWLKQHYPEYQVAKSASIACPYRTNAEWRAMRDEDPDSWADAVAFDAGIRETGTLGTMKERQYVHRSCLPLDKVDLSTPAEHGQREFGFLQECDGMCGV